MAFLTWFLLFTLFECQIKLCLIAWNLALWLIMTSKVVISPQKAGDVMVPWPCHSSSSSVLAPSSDTLCS